MTEDERWEQQLREWEANPTSMQEFMDRLVFSDEPCTGPLPTEQFPRDSEAHKLRLQHQASREDRADDQ